MGFGFDPESLPWYATLLQVTQLVGTLVLLLGLSHIMKSCGKFFKLFLSKSPERKRMCVKQQLISLEMKSSHSVQLAPTPTTPIPLPRPNQYEIYYPGSALKSHMSFSSLSNTTLGFSRSATFAIM